MSFDKHSNFNKQANFTEVKFGENKPVLEVELNELQQIQNEARADIVRDSIPSGFTQLGEIDYDYCLNNENKIKLKTDSVAYVNGYRINIPKDTIIDIGKAPEKASREDLLFLEVWKEEVTSDSVLTNQGGEGQAQINNTIKDSRYPIETTHRVALKWRIRHVADVDFDKFTLDGIYTDGNVNWSCVNRKITAQGGNPQPILENTSTDTSSAGMFIPVKYQSGFILNFPNEKDSGLFVTGTGGSVSKTALKTADGYVYAIPMFRLYRKPSCGKAMPFEYDKINPKVDYSKFTKLVQDEKVERVHSENIKGRSLVNLLKTTTFTGSRNSAIDKAIPVKPNTTYTLYFEDCENVLDNAFILLSPSITSSEPTTGDDTYTKVVTELGGEELRPSLNANTRIFKFTTKSTHNYIYTRSGDTFATKFKYTNGLLLEGDWTNKKIPEFFTGLKSLSEDDGNLVTVKNGVLNDNTYDPCDGNQKLNTFPNVTHVMSENTIIPEFTAELKKGEVKQSDVTAFGKLTTEGVEQVEFTKIKGRTLQNLLPKANIMGNLTTFYVYDINKSHEKMLKPNTKYTMVVYPSSSKIDRVYLKQGVQTTLTLGSNNMALFTTLDDISSISEFIHFYTKNDATLSEVQDTKIMLLEGDYTQTPLEKLPYIEGIKSVGETNGNVVNLTSMGKNIWNGNNKYVLPYKSTLHKVKLPNNSTKLRLSYDLLSTDYLFVFLSNVDTFHANHDTLYSLVVANGRGKEISYVNPKSTIIDNSEGYKYLYVTGGVGNSGGINVENIQLEVGNTLTEFEPYKEYKQEIYLKEPLRSLPNGICDEIVSNKVIRRVGKVIFNGSEVFSLATSDGKQHIYTASSSLKGKGGHAQYLVCDRFSASLKTWVGSPSNTVTTSNESLLQIGFTFNEGTYTVETFKTWLSQNPTTVYYELANPVEEYLEHVYEKESIKTYQLDAPLRSLSNNVKDEIKDDVLIRRCGEVILDDSKKNLTSVSLMGDGNTVLVIYAFKSQIIGDTTANFYNHISMKCDKFNVYPWTADFNTNYTEGIVQGGDQDFYIKIPKSKLTSPDSTGWKEWLKANPMKIIYALATPIETILTEAKPQNANFSLQRQFGEGNWLRELPNGVKDTVENGKVIRRIKEIKFNGSEEWNTQSEFDSDTQMIFFTQLPTAKYVDEYTTNVLCNKFTSCGYSDLLAYKNIREGCALNVNKLLCIYINRSKLATADVSGFKTWLSQNPVTVLYELNATTEEALSTNNYMPYPCHDFNTYCGSMYVGQGRNHVVNENKMPSEDVVIVDTPFRNIEGKAKLTDCRYKKQADGYNTEIVISTTKNIATNDYIYATIDGSGNVTPNTEGNRCASRKMIRVKPNTTYIVSRTDYVDQKVNVYYYDLTGKFISVGGYQNSFTTPSNCGFILYYVGTVQNFVASTVQVQIEEGTVATSYVSPTKVASYLEITESNDIEDLRHQVSLTGFNYDKILNESFDKLLRGEL